MFVTGKVMKPRFAGLAFAEPLLRFLGLARKHRRTPSGETGIRTPDTLLTYTRFPGVPLQPLEHLSFLSSFWWRCKVMKPRFWGVYPDETGCQPIIRDKNNDFFPINNCKSMETFIFYRKKSLF